ncbi:GntR family transcriptional regulator [Streptomyces sp. NPDC048290]|uniref:GntR family transcriptional regulator n=1 Tax=Streptomyces sp. NPDC048290 TaxID=3155811 RepID=UPI0034372E7A
MVLDQTARDLLRSDLYRTRRLPTGASVAAAGLARHTTTMRTVLDHWVPVAQNCRATEAGSRSAAARWDTLLAQAADPPHPTAPADAVFAFNTTVRELLRAINRYAARGPSIAEITDHLTTQIRSGHCPAGSALSPDRAAKALGVPRERVKDAVGDLIAAGVLERRGVRVFVRVPGDGPRVQARCIAGRLTAQIAAGLYPPGTLLPRVHDLAQRFLCQAPLINTAVRLLTDSGLLHLTDRGRAQVQNAALALPAPARAPALPPAPHPPGTHPHPDLLSEVRSQWRHHTPVTAGTIDSQWAQLRHRASQTATHRDTDGPCRFLTELASAPLPDPQWLRPWHLAILATALSNALPPAPPHHSPVPVHPVPAPRARMPLHPDVPAQVHSPTARQPSAHLRSRA